MSTIRSLLAIALLSVAATPAASAKCPFATYTIKGVVVDDIGDPVPGASVRVYLDDSRDAAKPEGEAPISRADGTFELQVRYDTLKSYSFIFDHNCSRHLTTITIAVTSPGYESLRSRIDLKRRVKATSDLDFSIQLDPAVLTKTTSEHQ